MRERHPSSSACLKERSGPIIIFLKPESPSLPRKTVQMHLPTGRRERRVRAPLGSKPERDTGGPFRSRPVLQVWRSSFWSRSQRRPLSVLFLGKKGRDVVWGGGRGDALKRLDALLTPPHALPCCINWEGGSGGEAPGSIIYIFINYPPPPPNRSVLPSSHDGADSVDRFLFGVGGPLRRHGLGAPLVHGDVLG